jgi:4-azaleucine resistance transporter AzlC
MAAETASEAFRNGARDVLPLLVGVAPFAAVVGVTTSTLGVSEWSVVAMAAVIYAGAAQLASIQLLTEGAPAIVVVVTAAIINLRFLMYSASLGQYLRRLPPVRKSISAYLVADQVYALTLPRFRNEGIEIWWYYLGAGIAMWVTWIAGNAVGAVLGARVPPSIPLEFALPLTFIGLLFPVIEDGATALAALVAAVVAIPLSTLPNNLGLLVALAAGIATGVGFERWWGE